MEPTRPGLERWLGDSSFGEINKPLKDPRVANICNIYSGRVRATAHYEVTCKDKMKRMEGTDVVKPYLLLIYSRPNITGEEQGRLTGQSWEEELGEITRGSRSHLERSWCSQTSGPGRPLASHIKPLI